MATEKTIESNLIKSIFKDSALIYHDLVYRNKTNNNSSRHINPNNNGSHHGIYDPDLIPKPNKPFDPCKNSLCLNRYIPALIIGFIGILIITLVIYFVKREQKMTLLKLRLKLQQSNQVQMVTKRDDIQRY